MKKVSSILLLTLLLLFTPACNDETQIICWKCIETRETKQYTAAPAGWAITTVSTETHLKDILCDKSLSEIIAFQNSQKDSVVYDERYVSGTRIAFKKTRYNTACEEQR